MRRSRSPHAADDCRGRPTGPARSSPRVHRAILREPRPPRSHPARPSRQRCTGASTGPATRPHAQARRRGYRLRHWRLINRQLADLLRQQHEFTGNSTNTGPGSPLVATLKASKKVGMTSSWRRDAKRRLGQASHELVGVHLVQLVLVTGIGAGAAADYQHRYAVEKRFADATAACVRPAAGTIIRTRSNPTGG